MGRRRRVFAEVILHASGDDLITGLPVGGHDGAVVGVSGVLHIDDDPFALGIAEDEVDETLVPALRVEGEVGVESVIGAGGFFSRGTSRTSPEKSQRASNSLGSGRGGGRRRDCLAGTARQTWCR